MFNRYRLKEKTNKLLEEQNLIISEKNKDISDSINYAKKIQDAILPSQSEIEKVFPEQFILSLPKDVVSGDFYWFTQYEHLKLFVVADCTGHGVPGAFMSMIGNTLLNNIVIERNITRPDLILNELRKEIIKALKQGEDSQSKDGMDISLICLNTNTNILQAACANNPIWIIKKDRSLIEIKADKQPIGYVSNVFKDFTLHDIQLEKGDSFYQFTDGYADQFGGEKGKKFKYNQLKEILIEHKELPLKQQMVVLKNTFDKWRGNLQQIDDVLVSGIRV
jgi:serine phosphatase RsbU (regulator of sigma subunit)